MENVAKRKPLRIIGNAANAAAKHLSPNRSVYRAFVRYSEQNPLCGINAVNRFLA